MKSKGQFRGPRRAGVGATLGLIVEGPTEFEAFRLLPIQRLIRGCPPFKVKNLGGVGSDRKPIGIAKLIAPKVIAHQVEGRSKVIICIDREQRQESAPQLACSITRALADELLKRSRSMEGVTVVVADRSFEAWILADARGLHERGQFVKEPKFHSFEGRMGENDLKGLVELCRLLDREYVKTRDGPKLFAKLDFTAARSFQQSGTGSRSLDKLLRSFGV